MYDPVPPSEGQNPDKHIPPCILVVVENNGDTQVQMGNELMGVG